MTSLTNLNSILAELNGIEIITESNQLTKLSLDYYHFSPILQNQLKDKRADLVVCPSNEEEVLRVVRACVKYRVPLTVRGAGTGNYGQCIPLVGGVVLDLTGLNQIYHCDAGMARVDAGVKLGAIDKQARELGWELRMYPSTYRTATIGGFIAGGSGGIGSINYGQLGDRGNLLAVRVITLEEQPQIIELRGDEVQQVNHAYGTNGIITQLDIPLVPSLPWSEIIVTFNDFMTAAHFGQALADSDGILKKLITVCAAPIPTYLVALKDYLPDGKSCAMIMVADFCQEPLADLVQEWQGEITYQKTAEAAQKGLSLAEFSWNHTTLHARSVEPNLTYLQVFYFDLDRVQKMATTFGDEVMIHLEFLRVGGKAIPTGLPLVQYSTPERLTEIIHYHEQQGAFIANPHTYILEDGGRKVIDPKQLQFKKRVDPFGLLNPGKMRAWLER